MHTKVEREQERKNRAEQTRRKDREGLQFSILSIFLCSRLPNYISNQLVHFLTLSQEVIKLPKGRTTTSDEEDKG